MCSFFKMTFRTENLTQRVGNDMGASYCNYGGLMSVLFQPILNT
jgi:hypothetical protein